MKSMLGNKNKLKKNTDKYKKATTMNNVRGTHIVKSLIDPTYDV